MTISQELISQLAELWEIESAIKGLQEEFDDQESKRNRLTFFARMVE